MSSYPQHLPQIFHLFPPNRQNVLFKALHLDRQAVVGPGKHLGDVIQVYKIAFMDAVEAAGGEAFFVFTQKLVLRVVLCGGMYDTASAGCLNVDDLLDI